MFYAAFGRFFLCVPFLEPRRAGPAQCRVDADPVVEDLNVLEQGEHRLLAAVVGAGRGSGPWASPPPAGVMAAVGSEDICRWPMEGMETWPLVVKYVVLHIAIYKEWSPDELQRAC